MFISIYVLVYLISTNISVLPHMHLIRWWLNIFMNIQMCLDNSLVTASKWYIVSQKCKYENLYNISKQICHHYNVAQLNGNLFSNDYKLWLSQKHIITTVWMKASYVWSCFVNCNTHGICIRLDSRVKVVKLMAEFRILRLTFHRNKMLNSIECLPQNAEFNRSKKIASPIHFQFI